MGVCAGNVSSWGRGAGFWGVGFGVGDVGFGVVVGIGLGVPALSVICEERVCVRVGHGDSSFISPLSFF